MQASPKRVVGRVVGSREKKKIKTARGLGGAVAVGRLQGLGLSGDFERAGEGQRDQPEVVSGRVG